RLLQPDRRAPELTSPPDGRTDLRLTRRATRRVIIAFTRKVISGVVATHRGGYVDHLARSPKRRAGETSWTVGGTRSTTRCKPAWRATARWRRPRSPASSDCRRAPWPPCCR